MGLNEVADWQGEIKRLAETLTEALDSCPVHRCVAISEGTAYGHQLICPECSRKLDALLALVRRGPDA